MYMKWWKSNWILFLYSAISALDVTMDLNVADAPEAGIMIGLYQQIYKLITIVAADITGKGFLLSILTLLFFGGYWYIWKQKKMEVIRYSKGVSLFLSLMYVAGVGYAYQNTVTVLFQSSIRLLKTAIMIAGFFMIFLAAMNLLYAALNSKADLQAETGRILSKRPFLWYFLIIFGVWFVHLLLRYPGAMSYDNARELSYYFGYADFTTAQPIFHTVLFSFFIQIGLWIGSENIGLFLFVLFQSAVMAAVLAYTLLQMKKWNVSRWLRVLTLVVYTWTPYYVGYLSFPIKDYLYTAFFVFLLMLSFKWDELTGKEQIGWILSGSLLVLLRNNGKIIYLAVFVVMLVHIIRKKKLEKRNLLVLALPLILSSVITAGITAAFAVQKDTPKEMLSLPFQQTARYVRDYGDDVTVEEKEAIGKVLDYNKIADVYMELTSDPVKTTYHAESTDDLMAYFKVWFKQFWKHPLCYVEATWNQNYYLFAPNIDNIVYNKDCTIAHEIMEQMGMQEQISFQVPEKMHGICSIMVSYYTLLHRLPVIGMLSNVGFYIILLWMITFFFLKDGRKRELWLLLPLWLTFLIIIASPQIQNQPRYAFPIIYAMPILIAYYKKGCVQDVG